MNFWGSFLYLGGERGVGGGVLGGGMREGEEWEGFFLSFLGSLGVENMRQVTNTYTHLHFYTCTFTVHTQRYLPSSLLLPFPPNKPAIK